MFVSKISALNDSQDYISLVKKLFVLSEVFLFLEDLRRKSASGSFTPRKKQMSRSAGFSVTMETPNQSPDYCVLFSLQINMDYLVLLMWFIIELY